MNGSGSTSGSSTESNQNLQEVGDIVLENISHPHLVCVRVPLQEATDFSQPQRRTSIQINSDKNKAYYARNKDKILQRKREYRQQKRIGQSNTNSKKGKYEEQIDDVIAQASTNTQHQNTFTYMNTQRITVTTVHDPLIPCPYSSFQKHRFAHKYFNDQFYNNPFGCACSICDRLWFQKDLKKPSTKHEDILHTFINGQDINKLQICSTCKSALDKNKIPNLSVYNGFCYPHVPNHLPKIDFIAERLLSPRIPFVQIRRLRHVHGQFAIYGQIINVPVSVDTMVTSLPRNVNDEHCIYVHIKKKLIHKSSFVHGLINIKYIKSWLKYLLSTPLYQHYNITVNEAFFDQDIPHITQENIDDFSEDIDVEESLTAQQQTLLWNEEKYLALAPGQDNLPQSLLFDEHAEELSFPTIYLGQFRKFRDNIIATPFMVASSELRRRDRRGVDPYHLLYMAVKIMRLRVRDCLTIAFKHVGKDIKISKQQIESEEYINSCIETNLAFLRSIPNSVWYWSEKKKDLFAMIRQKGKPTAFMTLSANEIGWPHLLKLLYTLAQEEDKEFIASKSNFIANTSLVNNDAVTCAIYFNKLVNVIMSILQSKKMSPFGEYRVVDYFKRIEFQHRGSPHAHILLWLDNAPNDILREDINKAIHMIDSLISVSSSEASGNIKLQTHKHTFTCYKKVVSNSVQKCRFDAPFMPAKFTMILVPMEKTEPFYAEYSRRYSEVRMNLESSNYNSFDEFYESNNIRSDEDYRQIIRAGINRPRVFLKRQPSEKLHSPFNPFVFNLLKSNMDFQIITEEYSCAAYVVEYVNKTNRGVSHLQRKITEIMNQHPEFDIVQITRKLSVDMLNSVEMSSQEAAWYLLREPMSRSSVCTQFINTSWPIERLRMKKTLKEISQLEDDCTDIWKEDCFDKYEKRPQELENVSLAQFVSKYNKKNNGYVLREHPRVIRYRNYDIADQYNEYRREMVTLHLPFRNEEIEILAEMKFLTTYDEYENIILQKRKEFESNIDIQKTLAACRQLCLENEHDIQENTQIQNIAERFPEPNPFQALYNNPYAIINEDLRLATLKSLGAIAKKRENIMGLDQFCELMGSTNEKQRDLLLHVIHHILSEKKDPLQIFFTGPAGCGKTFVVKLIMEIYNRFTNNDGFCNTFISCASTGKAAIAIDGTTIHTALKISLSKLLPLSTEMEHQYRCLFKYVKVLLIDEVSMIGAELLNQIDQRLKQITGNFSCNFGGIDIIFIGDLRQLPPVRATRIYKQPKQRMVGPVLWRDLKFYELTEVMRQSNTEFSNLLTKIGNGSILEENELSIIQSRFFKKEEITQLCPNGIRLFHDNASVHQYNASILNQAEHKHISIAIDIILGCSNREQETFVRQKLHKMSVIDTGGLPYEITFVIGKPYIVTANIDVCDGIANGAVGTLAHIETNESNQITRLWLIFPLQKTGKIAKAKAASYVVQHNIDKRAVPIARRTTTVSLNNNKTIVGKRNHFPLIPGCAMTIHKSQGGSYGEIVYEYCKSHSIQLLYVALSRVTSLEGLYLCNRNDDLRFYHGRRVDPSIVPLQQEFLRLSSNTLPTIQGMILQFMSSREGLSLLSLNCQSLRKHASDLQDTVCKKSNFLLLSETWLPNEENISIPNFHCIAQFKRPNVRAGGVIIYQNDNVSTITTENYNICIRNANEISNVVKESVGDLCAAKVVMQDGKEFLMVVIYISPNTKIQDIIDFIHMHLLPYTREGSRILKKNYHELPMVLSGDFNTNFARDDSSPLVSFLKDAFDLHMNNDSNQHTTRYGTTIDAVFTRYLHNVYSNTFVSYFSYLLTACFRGFLIAFYGGRPNVYYIGIKDQWKF